MVMNDAESMKKAEKIIFSQLISIKQTFFAFLKIIIIFVTHSLLVWEKGTHETRLKTPGQEVRIYDMELWEKE